MAVQLNVGIQACWDTFSVSVFSSIPFRFSQLGRVPKPTLPQLQPVTEHVLRDGMHFHSRETQPSTLKKHSFHMFSHQTAHMKAFAHLSSVQQFLFGIDG